MKAVVCRQYGPIDGLRLEEIPAPAIRPGCVRIDVRYASINPPDVLMAQGRYQVKPDVPFVLGVEGMGVVSEVGAGVADLRVGDRVMTYAGQGCLAQQVVAPAEVVFPVPDGMDDAIAAGFVLVYATDYHGLVDCGRLAAGETLLVLGAAGGLGLAAIELGKALGATVIAAASTEAKRAQCKAQGADHVIDGDPATLRDRIREATGGRGPDVVFDSVGGPWTELVLRSIAPYGRLLIVGYASGEIPAIKANLVLLKQAQVIGVSVRMFAQRDPAAARRNVAALTALWGKGALRPPPPTVFPAQRAVDALAHVEQRRVIGKAAVDFRRE